MLELEVNSSIPDYIQSLIIVSNVDEENYVFKTWEAKTTPLNPVSSDERLIIPLSGDMQKEITIKLDVISAAFAYSGGRLENQNFEPYSQDNDVLLITVSVISVIVIIGFILAHYLKKRDVLEWKDSYSASGTSSVILSNKKINSLESKRRSKLFERLEPKTESLSRSHQKPRDKVTSQKSFPEISTRMSRKVNVWIKDHDSEKAITLDEYDLMLNVGAEKVNTISSSSAEFLEGISKNNPNITVVLTGNDFEIPVYSKNFILPEDGDSDDISFKIRPLKTGKLTLYVHFYYKFKLLQLLSVSLNVQDNILKQTKSNTKSMLHTTMVLSSKKELNSVFDYMENGESNA